MMAMALHEFAGLSGIGNIITQLIITRLIYWAGSTRGGADKRSWRDKLA
jgi:hypothetical protein